MKRKNVAVAALLAFSGLVATSTIVHADFFDEDDMQKHDSSIKEKKEAEQLLAQLNSIAYSNYANYPDYQAALAQIPAIFVGSPARITTFRNVVRTLQNTSFFIGGNGTMHIPLDGTSRFERGENQVREAAKWNAHRARLGAVLGLTSGIATGDFELGLRLAKVEWMMGLRGGEGPQTRFDALIVKGRKAPAELARLEEISGRWLFAIGNGFDPYFPNNVAGEMSVLNTDWRRADTWARLMEAEMKFPGIKFPEVLSSSANWGSYHRDMIDLINQVVSEASVLRRGQAGPTTAEEYLAHLDATLSAKYGLPGFGIGVEALAEYAVAANAFEKSLEYPNMGLRDELKGILGEKFESSELFARIVNEMPRESAKDFWIEFRSWASGVLVQREALEVMERQLNRRADDVDQQIQRLNAAKEALKLSSIEVVRALERGERGIELFRLPVTLTTLAYKLGQGKLLDAYAKIDFAKLLKAMNESERARQDIREWANLARMADPDLIEAMVSGLRITYEVKDSLRPDLKPGFIDAFLELNPEVQQGYKRAMDSALENYQANPLSTDAEGALMTFNDHLKAGVEQHVATLYQAAPARQETARASSNPCPGLFAP